mgnify:FL=1
MLIVYYSSATENTHKFVQKLGLPNTRIPIKNPTIQVHQPYILICPTYGGGATLHGETAPHLPKQVAKFLNHSNNANQLKAVIASGNTNFGIDYAAVGKILSTQYNIPLLHTFELMGTQEDVTTVRNTILEKAQSLQLTPLTKEQIDTLHTTASQPPENQTRLEALREKYGH